MIRASIGTSKVNTPLSEKEINQALEEFEKEEEPVFPQASESLVDFLSKKKKAKKEIGKEKLPKSWWKRSKLK